MKDQMQPKGSSLAKYCGVPLLLLVASSTMAVDTAGPQQQIEALFRSYFELFNAGKSTAIAKQIFATPVQFSIETGHDSWESESDIVRGFDESLNALRAEGWAKSSIHELSVCVLADNLALVDLTYSRLRVDGRTIPPRLRKGVYVVLQSSRGWRIIADYGHDVEARVSCSD
jgi:hypothetical protein